MRVIASLCLALLSLTSVAAVPTSFCAKYTQAVFNNTDKTSQYNLFSAVVFRTIYGCNAVDPTLNVAGKNCTTVGPVAFNPNAVVIGLLDSASLNRQFFDGTRAFTPFPATNAEQVNTDAGITRNGAVSTRFVNVTGLFNATSIAANPAAVFLVNHLISFFAKPLGCDVDAALPGSSTTGIAPYNGQTDMRLHDSMAINQTVFNNFGAALTGSMKSYGVSQSDIDTIIVPFFLTFGRGQNSTSQICSTADCACATGYTLTNGNCVAPAAGSSSSSSSTGGNTPVGTGSSATVPPTSPPAKTNGTASAVSPTMVILGATMATVMLL